MTSPENSDTPTHIGLCPGRDAGEFYYPLSEAEIARWLDGHTVACPQCPAPLVIYVAKGIRTPFAEPKEARNVHL